jgi:hypothetical protein
MLVRSDLFRSPKGDCWPIVMYFYRLHTDKVLFCGFSDHGQDRPEGPCYAAKIHSATPLLLHDDWGTLWVSLIRLWIIRAIESQLELTIIVVAVGKTLGAVTAVHPSLHGTPLQYTNVYSRDLDLLLECLPYPL